MRIRRFIVGYSHLLRDQKGWRAMKYNLTAFLAVSFLLTPGYASSSPQGSSSRQNLSNCLQGFSTCDVSQLSPAERSQVEQAAHQRNYRDCINGFSSCNRFKLTESERPQVQQAAHQRNYRDCLNGFSSCDPSKLTESERPQIQLAAHQRNYRDCLNGFSSCNPSKLTESERPLVQQAAHQRNYRDCLNGFSSCNKSALNDEEKSKLASRATASATPQSPPHYYTNKDGVRVQSPTYYNSQPAAATAQCADGTFSFSLNHRGTCSHHGGVSKWLDKTPIAAPVRPGTSRQTFAGYACSSDCSGHAAGYRWAQEHDINDADDCDTAGERSNSPSFAEGCRAFVEGEAPQSDESGSMDDDEPAESDDPEVRAFLASPRDDVAVGCIA
jgi:Protein of unknown function (DUF3761)